MSWRKSGGSSETSSYWSYWILPQGPREEQTNFRIYSSGTIAWSMLQHIGAAAAWKLHLPQPSRARRAHFSDLAEPAQYIIASIPT